ncbi:MAG: HEAT repeat domain-containing protein [Lentisphaeria bacterium]
MVIGKTLLAMFPLLLPVWEERPFEQADFDFPPPPVYVGTRALEFQAEGAKYVSSETQETIFKQLGQSNNEEAVPILLEQLDKSDKPEITATILRAMRNFKDSPELSETDFAPYLKSSSSLIRRAATALVGTLEDFDNYSLIQQAHEDSDNQVQVNALRAIVRRLGEGESEDDIKDLEFNSLEDLRESENLSVRQLAWKVSFYCHDIEAYDDQIKQAGRDETASIRVAVAECLPSFPVDLTTSLVEMLREDENSSVRKELASVIPELAINDKQNLLVELLEDTDPEVRRVAAERLREFPQQEVAKALFDALAYDSAFVGRAAEESLLEIHDTTVIDELAVTALQSENDNRRYHALRILGKLETTEHAEDVAVALRNESNTRNLAAALQAAFHVRAKSAESEIKDFCSHNDAEVRSSAAVALGMFDYEAVQEDLTELLNDDSDDVRHKAIISMGRIENIGFKDELIEVLKSVENNHDYNTDCRAAACWAAARLRPVDTELAQRLKKQATEAIVKIPMGPPAYESSPVLISALFGLADMARQSEDIIPLFKEVAAKHSTNSSETSSSDSSTPFPASETLREYARQAKAFYNDRAIEPALRSTGSLNLIYQEID